MKRSTWTVGAAAMSAILGSTATSNAQSTEGAFQLGLSTALLSYTNTTTTVEAGGLEVDVDSSTTNWGVRNPVAAELGYGITDSLVLGGFLQLGGESSTVEPEGGEESESSEFELLLGPKLDFMLSPGQEVRPFFGAMAGLLMGSADDEASETSVTGFQLLGRVGLRAFLAPGFSIDPALAFSWFTASGETERGPTTVDASVSGINVGLLIGFSGWVL
jgi:hypothetical protein